MNRRPGHHRFDQAGTALDDNAAVNSDADFEANADDSLFGGLPEPEADHASPLLRADSLAHTTVMMVDDDPMMTDVIQTYLEEAGYQRFVSVNDPLLALDVARAQRPGLVLLDLMMPGLSGFEILEQMRADRLLRYVPVIVLTAASNSASKLRALELGATEFLAKPVDPSELVLRVRNSLAFKLHQDRLADDDPLTGLPNRRAFVERLERALRRARDSGRLLALLHIGLDRFKQINDTLGHGAGDRLLIAVAQRLRSCTRRSDRLRPDSLTQSPMLCRLSGDEFGLLVADIDSPAAADRVARRVLSVMSDPFEHDGKELFITPSIGISVYPEDGDTDELLLRNADTARTYAKASGRNTSHFYSAAVNSVSLERLALETELHRAIGRDQLVLHYQPKIDLRSGRAVGAEALLRWMHPQLGLVPPDRFIPIAEETGLIVEMGQWAVRSACCQLARWRDAGAGDLRVAVNVSRHELAAGVTVGAVREALRRYAVRPEQLIVELTESMLMDRVQDTVRQLNELRGIGIELSIDDFGTGYSSLNYLKHFPVNELKIDRSFIMGMPQDQADGAIVGAIVTLGHSLKMRVVAEGIETEAQRALLQSLGCDVYQGYLCSRPLPADDFLRKYTEINCAQINDG